MTGVSARSGHGSGSVSVQSAESIGFLHTHTAVHSLTVTLIKFKAEIRILVRTCIEDCLVSRDSCVCVPAVLSAVTCKCTVTVLVFL